MRVSDRWHLWSNLCGKVLAEVRSHTACWATAVNPARPGGVREQTTRKRWHKVHKLLGQSVGRLECARRLDVALNTVKRYARMKKPTGDSRTPLQAHARRSLPRPPDARPSQVLPPPPPHPLPTVGTQRYHRLRNRAACLTDPNQVEPSFGLLTDKLIRRGVHTSVKALEDDMRAWIETWNEDPKPFTWTKSTDEILKSLTDYYTKIAHQPPTTSRGLNPEISGASH